MATEKPTREALEAKAQIRALSQGIKIFTVEPGLRYVTPSVAREGLAYELFVRDDSITCSCDGFTYTTMCKHVRALGLRLEAEKKLKQALGE